MKFLFQIAMRGSVQTTHKYRQVVKMFTVMLILFVICRGPWHLIDIVIDSFQRNYDWMPADSDLLKQMALVLVVSNSWMMPVVYSLFNASIRGCLLHSMHHLFRVLGKPKERAIRFCCYHPSPTNVVEPVLTPVGTDPFLGVATVEPVVSVFVVGQGKFARVFANVQHS